MSTGMVCGRGYAFVSRQVQLTLVETVVYGLVQIVCTRGHSWRLLILISTGETGQSQSMGVPTDRAMWYGSSGKDRT